MNRIHFSPKLTLTMIMIMMGGLAIHSSLSPATAHSSNPTQDLNAPAPEGAEELLKRARELAEHDKPEEAITSLRKALSIAPHYLRAHIEYIHIKVYHLDQYDAMRAEYESLLAKEPDNPVYLMALALEEPLSPQKIRLARFKRVSETAPGWAWAHYAKARLLQEDEPEAAVAELFKCIEKDRNAVEAYELLLKLQERRLGRIDDAISTAEKMVANPETRISGLETLWRLRLAKAQDSEESKAQLEKELSQLVASSRDINLLSAVRRVYSSLLKDKESARRVEERMREIDATWYPYRGVITSQFALTSHGISRHIVTINRQSSIVYGLLGIDLESDPQGIGLESDPHAKMALMEKLFSLGPKPNVQYLIYTKLLATAEQVGDEVAVVKYGEALRAVDPTGPVWPAKIALALADQKRDLRKALAYARFAEKATATFRLPQRPVNTNPDFVSGRKDQSEDQGLQADYKWKRAVALDALGWVRYQMGKYREAEANLRQAVELSRSEKNLSHLSQALAKIGRTEEAEKVAEEAKKEYVEAIKRQFISAPAKEFELESLDGRTIKLSELKGKVVMLNFWATWCGPCIKEMPHLVKLYEKYKDRGFEILAISVDSDSERYKVAPFAKERKLTFPVLYNKRVEKLYDVPGYPTSIFIDRQGRVRYRQIGYWAGVPRELDVVISELLQQGEHPGISNHLVRGSRWKQSLREGGKQ